MHRSMGNVVLVGVQRGRDVRAHLHVCWRSINEGDDGTKIYRDRIDQDVISSYIGSSCSYRNNVPAALAERVLPYRPAFFFFFPARPSSDPL